MLLAAGLVSQVAIGVCIAQDTFTHPKRAIVGTPGPDTIRGGPGADRIFGRDGDDRIVSGPGPDLVSGDRGADTLSGGAGGDVILGGGGNDRLVGGSGRDLLLGGNSDDSIRARDGAVDTISCGPGRDRVIADRIDHVRRDCELKRLLGPR